LDGRSHHHRQWLRSAGVSCVVVVDAEEGRQAKFRVPHRRYSRDFEPYRLIDLIQGGMTIPWDMNGNGAATTME
jgi:hypothetical protein